MIAELLSDRIIGSIFFLLGSLCLIRYLYKEHNNMDIPTKIVTVLGLIGAICLADKNISGFFYPILKLKIKNFDLLFASVLGISMFLAGSNAYIKKEKDELEKEKKLENVLKME